ncbi:MAG: dihydrodipicolinate synthase family protein [Desulfovibrio sp.]|jgi:4-hydroxy-tetrahydrodipicolinate synthase|nr:dihydrodipicolinate synthase family protein [Desulfovibrio sp.]
MSENCRLRGVLSPVLTPFKEDLSPDLVRYAEHCRWLIDSGVALAVFGTNSEANSLSVNERLQLLDTLLEAGIPPSKLLPGTGCCALPDTVELTRKAVEAGCAGVLTLPPFYYKNVSDDGLFNSYSEIIQRVGNAKLRIYLYHIPPVSQTPISLALIERLLKAYPGIVAGIKDSSGDWNNTEAMLKNFQSDSFDVFCGSEVFLLRNMRGGGAGCITATGNVNPAAIVDLYKTWRDAGADDKQAALSRTRKCFEIIPMIASMKCCIAWKRKYPSWAVVRPPLVRASAEKAEQLQKALQDDGFEMPGISA